jgi:glycosyltransferase involved in cell wall biosynthesis
VVEELLTNCFAYVHGNEAGGTNPGLLQAMGAGCAVISRDVVFNREVCGRTAVYFAKDAGDLRAKMGWALGHEAELPAMREASRARVRDRYDWDAVTDDYERLFLSL